MYFSPYEGEMETLVENLLAQIRVSKDIVFPVPPIFATSNNPVAIQNDVTNVTTYSHSC